MALRHRAGGLERSRGYSITLGKEDGLPRMTALVEL